MTATLPVVLPLMACPPVPGGQRITLAAVTGAPLAEVEQVPPLLAQVAAENVSQRAYGGQLGSDVFERAASIFTSTEICGEDQGQHCRAVARAAGLPLSVVRRGMTSLARGLGQLHEANEAELPCPVRGDGYSVEWLPRSAALAVVAPGNHQEPHLAWARALALGLGVVVKPSSRDPFTPLRLARALLAAGLPQDRLAVLPGDHRMADHLVRFVGRAMIYGGTDVVSRWSGRSDVLVRGPGRTKIVLGSPPDAQALDHLIKLVAGDGGVRCTNASVILASDDVTRLAAELAARLAELPVLPVTHPDAVLPAVSAVTAAALRNSLAKLVAAGLADHSSGCYGGDPFTPSADGSFIARPVILSTKNPEHQLLGTELPFPFAVVAPWRGGIAALRDSLVVNLVGVDSDLIEPTLAEPTVRKVVVGLVAPWESRPGLPHDGSLISFLLEPKALVRNGGSQR